MVSDSVVRSILARYYYSLYFIVLGYHLQLIIIISWFWVSSTSYHVQDSLHLEALDPSPSTTAVGLSKYRMLEVALQQDDVVPFRRRTLLLIRPFFVCFLSFVVVKLSMHSTEYHIRVKVCLELNDGVELFQNKSVLPCTSFNKCYGVQFYVLPPTATGALSCFALFPVPASSPKRLTITLSYSPSSPPSHPFTT